MGQDSKMYWDDEKRGAKTICDQLSASIFAKHPNLLTGTVGSNPTPPPSPALPPKHQVPHTELKVPLLWSNISLGSATSSSYNPVY